MFKKFPPPLQNATIFRALRHRNFRLFISGQAISLIGTWVQSTAMGWLVYRLTGSVFMLGFIGFANQIPAFFLTPVTGVIADRMDRKKIVLTTQTMSMLQAFVLAGLVLSGSITVWHLVVLSFTLGIINALDMPARQSFFLEMVENKDDLGNAIALNSSVVNAGRLIGPFIGGILIATMGEGLCFLVNAVSYGAVIVALLRMRISVQKERPPSLPALRAFKQGVRYALGFAPIKWMLMLIGVTSLVGLPYAVFMPVFARDLLHGGPHMLGFLLSGSGLGALAGALFLASRKSVVGLVRWLARATLIFGAALVAFSFSHVPVLSFVLVLFVGFGMIVQLASCNTLLQTIADDDKRGRVMSFYTMAFMGLTPIGSLLLGAIANRIGADVTLCLGGLCSLAAGLIFYAKLPYLRKAIRPVYMKMGIIPEVAKGLQNATEPSIAHDG